MSESAPIPHGVARGTVIDRYELVLERGADAFATTWVARSTDKVQRLVECIVVDPYVAAVSEFRDAFLREGALLRRVSHPGFHGWTASAAHAGCLYAVRSAVEAAAFGEVLGAAARVGEPLAPGVIVKIAMEVLSALGAVHLVAKTAHHGDT